MAWYAPGGRPSTGHEESACRNLGEHAEHKCICANGELTNIDQNIVLVGPNRNGPDQSPLFIDDMEIEDRRSLPRYGYGQFVHCRIGIRQ